jgi:hypothetical protein
MTTTEENYVVWYERDDETGVVVGESWSKTYPAKLSTILHRIDGPAAIRRDPNTGVVVVEEWHREGNLHRDDGPAIIRRTPDGKVKYQSWYRDGQLIPHRRRPKAALPPTSRPS